MVVILVFISLVVYLVLMFFKKDEDVVNRELLGNEVRYEYSE